MISDNYTTVMMANNKFILVFKDKLKELALTDKYYLGIHFFEYMTLFQLHEKEKLLSEEEFEIITNKLKPNCIYIDRYPITEFLDEKFIEVGDNKIPVSLLEFLISDPRNYFSLQKLIFESKEDKLLSHFYFLNKESCFTKYFSIEDDYLGMIQKAIRILYNKLKKYNYDFTNDIEGMFKLFSDRNVNSENLFYLVKHIDFENDSTRRDEFLKEVDFNLVDGVLELLRNENITKEELEKYLSNNNSKYDYKYYVYLIKNIKDLSNMFLEYSDTLSRNIDEIYYNENIYYYFHPMIAHTLEEDEFLIKLGDELDGELDASILNYVWNNLPSNLNSKEELAFCLYVLLGDILQYDAAYVKDRNSKFNLMKDLTVKNNKTICRSWAVSYYKLLEHYGIKSYIGGYDHLSVYIPSGYTMYEADATAVNEYGPNGLSDLTNIKLNFISRAFMVESVSSYCDEEIEFRKQKLEKIKRSVYEKLGRNVVLEEDFYERACRYQKFLENRMTFNVGVFTKKDFDKTISFLNFFYQIPLGEGADIERGQFFNKYIDLAISGYPLGTVESIPLYRIDDDNISYIHLLSMRDSSGKNHVYLENNTGFVSCDGEDILNEVANGKLVFHQPVLEKRFRILCKHENEVN